MRSHDIVFLAVYGDEYRVVKITKPDGGGAHHLLIDKYYCGIVKDMGGKWEVILHNYTDQYTSADFDVIAEIMINQTS